MMHCITVEGQYVVADELPPGAVEVPERPTPTHKWDGLAWVSDTDLLWTLVREQRVPLLTEADHRWNKAFDNEQDTAPISAYRQALRDITTQADPLNFQWPAKPW